MNSQKHSSLQSIRRRRQQGEFIGRVEQISLFQQNLTFDLNDDRRRFIFNVFGQGGVGKTTLLRRFARIAEEANGITAWVDEIDEDVPTVMAHLAEQIGQQDHTFKSFNERYRVYRQRRQELETDPEAPQTSLTFVSQILTKVGVRLGRRIPVGGIALDFVNENDLASQVSEWATFVARKLTNKDEVLLVQEPVEVLTPLFLEGLQKATERHLVALFFDTYEHTGQFLDDWLRKLLDGHYSDVPSNIILSIAGRDELDKNRWMANEELLAHLPLEPFTEQEARDYLIRKGVVSEAVIEVILHLSGRFPLFVATLASESPSDPKQVGDPSGTAVERFLKWEDDPKKRQMLLDAALPRLLNRDVLALLIGEEDVDTFFTQLKQKPFVVQQGSSWVYHGVVRSQMLRYKLHESPQQWAELHSCLANYYEKRMDDLRLGRDEKLDNTVWQTFQLEALYHRLCQEPHKQVSTAYGRIFNVVYPNYTSMMLTMVERSTATVMQASEDSGVEEEFDRNIAKLTDELSQCVERIKHIREKIERLDNVIQLPSVFTIQFLKKCHMFEEIIGEAIEEEEPQASWEKLMRIFNGMTKQEVDDMFEKLKGMINVLTEKERKDMVKDISLTLPKRNDFQQMLEEREKLVTEEIHWREQEKQIFRRSGIVI